jgi:hypothetical protein
MIWGSHSGSYEEYYLLGCNAVYSVENQSMFGRNILPPSSGSNKQSKIPAWKQKLASCFHTGILLGLFDPEDGGDIFLWKMGWLSMDYVMLYQSWW